MDVALPRRARLGLALALGLGGCMRPGPPPPPVARPAATTIAPTTGSTSPPAEAFDPERRIGPLRRLAPHVFVARDELRSRARPSKVRASAVGLDGVRLDLGCTGGAALVRTRGKPSSLLAGRAFAAIHAARGGRFASVVADDGAIAVIEFATGRVRAIERRGTPHWVGDALLVRDGCNHVTIDPGDGTARELAPACGAVVGSGGGALWIAEPAAEDPATAAAIAAVALDGTLERIAFAPELPRDPIVSPDGEIVCGTFVREHQDLLQCRAIRGGRFERVALDVVGAPVFADDAPRMVVGVGEPGAAQRDLHVVDFAAHSIRRLGRTGHRRLAFLPGGARVIAYGGAPGMVFAMDTAERIAFGGADDDWIDIATIPGDDHRFYAARTRAGACRELVRIELPTDPAAPPTPSGSVVIEEPPPPT